MSLASGYQSAVIGTDVIELGFDRKFRGSGDLRAVRRREI